jgi:DNA-binding NarL/FixJ family response regulator
LFAICRTQYAEVLMWRGAWNEAEPELIAARDELARLCPGKLDEALVRLGQLRCRQGRFEEAQSLFEQLRHHPLAQLGLAEVAFETGDYSAADNLIERYLRRVPVENQAWRVAGLELAIRTYIAQDMPDRAGPMLDELCAIASHVNTLPLQATAHVCQGLVAAALDDNETAIHHFEDAADLFERCGIPFESACARLQLARTLFSLGKKGIAEKELQSTIATFEKLGAARRMEEARNLRHLPASNNHSSRLSPREVEVLQLVAQGLSNKEIAAHLHLSEHTIHRHVNNILAKLDLPSRAAAVAFAAQHHLL